MLEMPSKRQTFNSTLDPDVRCTVRKDVLATRWVEAPDALRVDKTATQGADLQGNNSGAERSESAQRHEWDLADGLIYTLSAPLPQGSPSAVTHEAMMRQILSDVTQTLLSTSCPDVKSRALRLLAGCGKPDALSDQDLLPAAQSLIPTAPLEPSCQLPEATPLTLPTLPETKSSFASTLEKQPAACTAVQLSDWDSLVSLDMLPTESWPAAHGQAIGSPSLEPDSALELSSFPTALLERMPGWPVQASHDSASTLPNPALPQRQFRTDAAMSNTSLQAVKTEFWNESKPGTRSAWSLETADGKRPRPVEAACDSGEAEREAAKRRGLRPRKATLPASLIAEELADVTETESGRSSGGKAAKQGGRARPPARKARKRGKKSREAKAVQGQSSSEFRGVSRHRLTQRWEASLWLCGKQLYLGGFESEEDAARAYDIAALASKGLVPTNFHATCYALELDQLKGASKEEIVAYVRRRSSAFARGRSPFRGVSGQDGRWEARIGTFEGKKNVSFGIFESEEQAARQYDRALVIEKGRAAKTNFPLSDYEREVDEYKALLRDSYDGVSPRELAATAETILLPLEFNLQDGSEPQPAAPDRSKGGRPRNSSAALVFAESLRKALSM